MNYMFTNTLDYDRTIMMPLDDLSPVFIHLMHIGELIPENWKGTIFNDDSPKSLFFL
jgi:hypothetical protein